MDSTTPPAKDQRSAFWSHEAPLRGGLENTVLREPSDDDLVQFYRGWRFCEYFPLAAGSSHTSGLTVYWEHEESKGIDVYGVSQLKAVAELPREDDSYLENAIHFPLQVGERITEVWARAAYNPITPTIFQTCHKCLVVRLTLRPPRNVPPFLQLSTLYLSLF